MSCPLQQTTISVSIWAQNMRLGSFLDSFLDSLRGPRWPVLIYAATWTTILTVTVAVASFTPEIAFVSAINPTSSLSQACSGSVRGRAATSVRLPLDFPSQSLCFPASLFKRSGIDMVVPPIFAAAIVACSACVVKAIGLWEVEDDHI